MSRHNARVFDAETYPHTSSAEVDQIRDHKMPWAFIVQQPACRGPARRAVAYPLAPQPLAALDLLDHPDPVARSVGRAVLDTRGETKPVVLARR